jgi:Cu(I)/Ag(I) efflux system membrane protein CusA/SilA
VEAVGPAPTLEDEIIIRPGLFTALVSFCIDNPFVVFTAVAMIVVAGLLCLRGLRLDALPDLSDNQVVILADWMGRSPEVIDDQVAYPLSTLLSALPNVKDVRAMSSFGVCMVYVIFDDDVDIYWARTRVSERLALARDVLPAGVTPTMGPEGTGVGHIYWYLVTNDDDPKTPPHDLAELRSLQDFYVRYQLATVEGVAEVASGGGYTREYHVDLDPDAMRRYMVMPDQVFGALRESNMDVGGGTLNETEQEFYVRSRGYLGRGANETDAVLEDIRNTSIGHDPGGIPIPLSRVATVQLGPAVRRGIIDHNGTGEAVTGIIVMRYGQNAKSVIDGVKRKLIEVKRGLPPGAEIVTAHDRSWLIERSVETLRHALVEEGVVVTLVILLFLLSLRPSIVVIVTLPIAVLAGFIGMYLLGITSNIMSLGGIAIAIGVITDDGIVMTENAHRHLANLWERCRLAGRVPAPAEITHTIRLASQQVAKPAFVTTLIVICGFLPVFFLTGQEGKLFGPLAWTKSLVMICSACLAVSFVPLLMTLVMRTRMLPEDSNPLNRFFNVLYQPVLRLAMELRWLTMLLAVLALLGTYPIYKSLGSEFMPNLNEGELVYMPTTMPNVSTSEAKRILQLTDAIMLQHPLVVNVVGKAGRADTATDPAPLSMIESFVQFLQIETRAAPWYDPLHLLPSTRKILQLPTYASEYANIGMYFPATGKLYSGKGGSWQEIDPRYAHYAIGDIRNDLDRAIKVPGLTNGWTMPIINRIQMLATGVRTDLGIKIYGDNMDTLSELAVKASDIAKGVPGVVDVFAEKLTGGRYLDIQLHREHLAHYGLTVGQVQGMIEMLLGGMDATTTVEGRERYSVRVRYGSTYRDTPAAIERMLIDTPHQGPIPLGTIATISFASGPSMITAENGLLRSVVFANVRGRDMVGTVDALTVALDKELDLPTGYSFRIAGQWENIQRARQRLLLIIPIVLVIIFVFLYLTFNDVTDAAVVFISLPYAFIGGLWYLHYLHFNVSVAVWVGFIALFGTAVNTGVLMMVYLQEALDRRLLKGWLRPGDIYSATLEGAGKRLRPKLMNVSASLIGLIPLMWATGIGSDVLKPVAAPLIGGLVSSTLMVLFVIPVLFFWVRSWQHKGLVRCEL